MIRLMSFPSIKMSGAAILPPTISSSLTTTVYNVKFFDGPVHELLGEDLVDEALKTDCSVGKIKKA